jgi:phosphopantetheine adenylyltransferase
MHDLEVVRVHNRLATTLLADDTEIIIVIVETATGTAVMAFHPGCKEGAKPSRDVSVRP